MSVEVADIKSPFDSPTFGKDGSFEVNKPVGSMSISPCGRDVVLASRHGLHIVDLDSPWAPPRHLAHHTPWEVADVQWSPFPSRDHWIVSTSNQKALVWNVEMSSRYSPIELVIHGHSRALTDVQFSAHHPDMLATCAVDSFVHCWDLRQPERPAFSFCDWFAGATQIKWNRRNSHIIASSHDRTLHIWDDRKGATPLRSLDAHDTKIYGVDWSRTDENKIITCSLDKSIKFWDFSVEGNRPERLLRTPFPVWRARHTPFGHGIVAMPQRGDFDVYLYDCREESIWDRDPDRAPCLVEKFKGHVDNVKEFLWRPRGSTEDDSDNREFQLVTWGSDHYLRLHQLDDSLLEKTGFQRGKPGHKTTRRGAMYKTFRVEDSELPTIPPQLGSLVADSYAGSGNSMSAKSLAGSLGWADSGFLNLQPGTRAKAPERKDLDPITWMKGVKIGKRDDNKARQEAISMSLPTLNIESWDHFDNLGEEVSHVGQTFSKVEFNTVDINKRFIRMSLSGPWGKEKSQAFLTCRLDYPSDYPAAAANISMHETNSIPSERAQEMLNTAKTIAQAFAQRKRHSTEALVHYLQGEKSLEDLIGLLKQGLETPDILPVDGGGDSSSEDEDELDPLSNAQLDELGLGDSDVLASANANANVPLPKACGAIWTNDGRLLCFFPPRPDKVGSTTATYGFDGLPGSARGKSRFFDGFGRFHPLSQGRQSRASSLDTIESSPNTSDSEDDSSLSGSSDSSISDGPLSDRPHGATQHMMYTSLLAHSMSLKPREGLFGSQASRPLEGSFLMAPKNVISIHDFKHLLPSKHELAHYQYGGVGAGSRNADMAAKAGFIELTDAWHMVSILAKAYASKPLSYNSYTKHVGTMAQPTINAGFSFNALGAESPLNTVLSSSAFDGVGATVARDLFGYFAGRADIQMAAAISCALQSIILSEPPNMAFDQSKGPVASSKKDTSKPSLVRHDSVAITEYGESLPQKESIKPIRTSPRDDLILNPSSLASSLGASGTDPRSSFSTGHTPPSRRVSKASAVKQQNPFQQLKPSPSRIWNLDNASGLIARAGNFASEISRLSLSASASPPSRKYPSPSISLKTSRRTRDSKSSLPPPHLSGLDRRVSLPDETYEEVRSANGTNQQSGRKRRFKVSYRDKNLQTLHRNSMSTSEYERLVWVIQAYRNAYAELLSIWGFPILRAELLKHSGSPVKNTRSHKVEANTPESNSDAKRPLELGKRSRTPSDNVPFMEAGVYIRRLCRRCSHPRWPSDSDIGTAPFKCAACQARTRLLFCVFCNRMLRGKSLPCSTCGHVMHARCRTRVAHDPVLTGQCPCGCECNKVVVEVKPAKKEMAAKSIKAYSSVDTLKTEVRVEVPSSPAQQNQQYEQHHRHRSFQEIEGPDTRSVGFAWARESLARNLKSRRPRARSVDRRAERGQENAHFPGRRRIGIGTLGEWS